MRQRLASADVSVEELLSGRYVFSIPAYQRDYAWTKDEALQLIDDIAAAIEDVEREDAAVPYFLGTMLLVTQPPAANGHDRPAAVTLADVVDGQQRLITLVIIFAVLRDLLDAEAGAPLDTLLTLPDPSGVRTYQLQLRSADAGFFRAAIQTPGATRHGQKDPAIGPSLARRNIEDVRRAISLRFQKELTPAERGTFVAFLRQHARVLLVSSDDLDYAYQIFLTINDRGKRLSVEDIFRGEILGPLDPVQRERYESVIEEMNKYMEAAEQQRAKGKTFFSHLANIYGWSRQGIIEGLKRAVVQRGGPRRFAVEVFAPMADVYLQVKGSTVATPLRSDVEERIEVLRWLERHGDDDWVPVAMLCLVRLGHAPDALIPYLIALDRFAHALMTLGCGRDARRKHYTPILRKLAHDDSVPPPDRLFELTVEDQKQILHRIATRLHKVDPATTKLVLMRADQAITGRPLADYRPLMDLARSATQRFTVEHVCPKGEVKDGEWLRLFPRQSRRAAAAQCIGNLVLVTEAQNKRVNQEDFAAKQQVFFQAADPAPFQLTEMLRSETTWDGPAIERRYELIMWTLKEMWSLEGPVPKCPATRSVKTPE